MSDEGRSLRAGRSYRVTSLGKPSLDPAGFHPDRRRRGGFRGGASSNATRAFASAEVSGPPHVLDAVTPGFLAQVGGYWPEWYGQHEADRDLKITQKAAWHLGHRIRETWKDETGSPFGGPVDRCRLTRRISGAASPNSNAVRAAVVPDTLQRFASQNIRKGGTMYSDDAVAYTDFDHVAKHEKRPPFIRRIRPRPSSRQRDLSRSGP